MGVHLHGALGTLQPEASHGGGGGAAKTGPGGCAMEAGSFLPLLIVFFLMYFLLLRPQQKQQKEHENMLKTLKRGSVVRTRSGVRGEVVEINERDVNLMIADRVKINILRSHIAGLETPAGSEGKSGDKTADKGAQAAAGDEKKSN